MTFDYGSFTGRNLGFVDESEQQVLREASVFVCGIGGMGGAAFMALARAGIGKFVIADIDRFEVSNLNRQVFAFNDAVGREKADVAAEAAPRPEERLGFPTLGKHWLSITDADKRAAMLAEIEHVMLHSSSRHYVDLAIAGEVAAGRRSRMSFAPMVISTGMLMAYEAIALILGHSSGADCRGWFLNPYRPAIERPRNVITAAMMRPFVRRAIHQLTARP